MNGADNTRPATEMGSQPLPVEIRTVTPCEQAQLATLLLQSSRHYWGAAEGDESKAERMAGALATGQSGCAAVIASVEAVAQGFATYTLLHPAPTADGTLFLKDLYVSAAARGKGVGIALMRHLARVAYDLGCTRFDWTAETDNPSALAFYDELGAERVTEKVYFRLSADRLGEFAKAQR